jgi:hypothetical protein
LIIAFHLLLNLLFKLHDLLIGLRLFPSHFFRLHLHFGYLLVIALSLIRNLSPHLLHLLRNLVYFTLLPIPFSLLLEKLFGNGSVEASRHGRFVGDR